MTNFDVTRTPARKANANAKKANFDRPPKESPPGCAVDAGGETVAVVLCEAVDLVALVL